MTLYHIVEKANPLAVHAHCYSRQSAQRWLEHNMPRMVARRMFMDKSLTVDSFEMKYVGPLPEPKQEA